MFLGEYFFLCWICFCRWSVSWEGILIYLLIVFVEYFLYLGIYFLFLGFLYFSGELVNEGNL